ncbi:SH3 and multiple ankyrin repeat domains protein 2-like isoform X3 [Mytilus californianus]|uniref:SH3 and multiple ankyrin repeat domains protein 2-like isoform X3 n=1 Tax=Mytilus californianus TaxID=6549 RepID=UPI0022478952|nr:SH3 and multiple ankyrin repeat domains protein 2-like isoform X3 [Mytilus californianus]
MTQNRVPKKQQAMSNGHLSAPPTVSGRKLPDFQLKKFIALPPGFKIKSPGTDQDSHLPRKPVPIKAVPLGLDGRTPVTTDYNGEINSFFTQPEPGNKLTNTTFNRRTDSISSIDSIASSGFSDFSLDSNTGSERRGRYRKRSQSTPPDIGRQSRSSPVDRKIVQKIKTEYNQILNQLQKGNLNPKNHNNNNVQKLSNGGNNSGFHSIEDWSDTSLDSLDLNDSTDWDVTFSHQSVPITGNHLGQNDNPTGQTTNIMHPQYLTLPRNFLSTSGGSELRVHKMDSVNRPVSSAHMNGSMFRNNGLVVYKPLNSGEFIMVGNHPEDSHGMMPGTRVPLTENRQSNLFKSRGLSSSMPTLLNPKVKVDKKLLKEIKRREKEEKKLFEKEEKRRREEEKKRIQEEKKRRKSILKEQKKLEKLGDKNRTLPKNWAYVNKPIESVYQRPHSHSRPKLSLSAVPIDFDDGPSVLQRSVPPPNQPPPPPPQMLQSNTAAKALYTSAPDLLRLEQVYGATIRGPSHYSRKHNVPNQGPVYVFNQPQSNYVSDYAPRTVVLQRGPEGYGFILRGAKSQSTRNGELDFHPTPEFPALQYLDSVDPSSRADRAGLKPGDFILEINGENVVRASHDRVVQVIRNSGDTLAMKVVTVRPQQNPVNWQHMDGTMTLPSRTTNSASGSKKQAPQPPRRDPRTSLSKEKGRQLAEGLNELDQLDLALAEFERENLEQHNVTTEQKTASIRAKHASKRVSCVDLSNIEGYDSEKSDHRSPSERIIHKYNNERKQSAMERSQSTPDLSDKKPEPVYATPVVPGSAGVQRRNDGTYVYAVPEDSLSMKSSTSTSERPKGPPPPPPGALGFKRPAPGVPKDEEVVQPSNTEVVSINTIGSRTSLYARPEKLSTAPQDDFESSFRPGASAKMTDEPKVKSKAHQRNSSLTSTNSGGSRQSDDKHSVSFAEDKVLDNAKTYLQKHPNAKLLVTADVHSNVKKQTGKYEPEPDYDLEDDKVKSRVTVISIGDRKTTDSEAKRYSVRSDIPAGNIPPPPSEPAPNPPTKTLAPGQQIAKSSAPQPAKAAAPQPSTVKSAAPKPPSPKSKTPSPKVEQKIVTQKKEEVKIENIPSAPAVPPMPPAAPPPPPAPPLPPAEPPAPPLPKSQPPAQTKQSNTTPQGIEANDLLAAVRKRQQRMDVEGPKISALPESKDGPQKDDNQAAIIAAVARRRRMLEEKGDTSVIDAIETKLQKTKKLQSAKLAFSSDNIGKTPEMKPKVAKPVEPKAIVNDVKSSMERQPPKVDIKPIKSVTVKGKEPTKIMSTVNGGAVKTPVKMEVKADTKTTDSNKAIITSTPKTENKENSVSSPRGKDYVALAEKARQEYLQKKASQTSLRVTATNNSPNTVSKPADRSKSPAKTIPTSPLIAQSTTNSSKVPIRDQNKNIITTGVQSDRTKVFSSVSQIPNGNVKNMSSKNKDNGVSSLKPAKDIGVISQNKTSIKDRIASINKAEQSKGNVNGKVPNEKLSVKGVTVESSGTDKSSLPPPPEFGDSVQLEIIPPPMGFDSGSNFSDISRQSSVFNQDDNESLVSSVSTVSTLSDDQADSGYGRQRHNYEELIAPPPPGFGDSNSNQGYETIPSVIPPPPSFGEEKRDLMNKSRQVTKPFSSKSVDNWQCLDVLDWLDSLKLSQYKTSFQQKCIDGKRLQNLSRNDYLDLGVTQVGHRMNLERSIKKLNLPKNVVSSSHL